MACRHPSSLSVISFVLGLPCFSLHFRLSLSSVCVLLSGYNVFASLINCSGVSTRCGLAFRIRFTCSVVVCISVLSLFSSVCSIFEFSPY